jgi:hypothetical protein
MTERKPSGVRWQSWTEHLIAEGQRAGAFDELDGTGRPIDDIGVVHDEMWWVKAKLRDEEINELPPTLAIRAERDAAVDQARAAATEMDVRTILDDINRRIRYVNSYATDGPPSSVMTIDVEEFVSRWSGTRPQCPVPAPEPDEMTDAAVVVPDRRRRWWQRFRRREVADASLSE